MARGPSGVRVEGLNRVLRDLQRLGLDIDDLKDAFQKVADRGAQMASTFAPRKSGRLAADVRGNRAKSKAVVRVGRASVPYAGALNYGWPARNIAATNYLQKTDKAMQPIAVGLLEQEIDRAIRRRGLNR